VVRVPTDVTAAQRARWLAEISDALEEAQKLIWRLGISGVRNVDAIDLSARLEAASAQVRSLRLGRANEFPENSNPEWSNRLPWDRPAESRP
jgi:hypothetical protein